MLVHHKEKFRLLWVLPLYIQLQLWFALGFTAYTRWAVAGNWSGLASFILYCVLSICAYLFLFYYLLTPLFPLAELLSPLRGHTPLTDFFKATGESDQHNEGLATLAGGAILGTSILHAVTEGRFVLHFITGILVIVNLVTLITYMVGTVRIRRLEAEERERERLAQRSRDAEEDEEGEHRRYRAKQDALAYYAEMEPKVKDDLSLAAVESLLVDVVDSARDSHRAKQNVERLKKLIDAYAFRSDLLAFYEPLHPAIHDRVSTQPDEFFQTHTTFCEFTRDLLQFDVSFFPEAIDAAFDELREQVDVYKADVRRLHKARRREWEEARSRELRADEQRRRSEREREKARQREEAHRQEMAELQEHVEDYARQLRQEKSNTTEEQIRQRLRMRFRHVPLFRELEASWTTEHEEFRVFRDTEGQTR